MPDGIPSARTSAAGARHARGVLLDAAAAEDQVRVRVDEPGRDDLACDVDDPGVGRVDLAGDLVGCADRQDAFARDRDACARPSADGIGAGRDARQHLSRTVQDQVGLG